MATYSATSTDNLNKTIATMKTGDMLHLAAGTYRQRIWCAVPGVAIVGGGAVIFDGSGVAMPPYTEFISVRASNVILENLTLKNIQREGIGLGDAQGPGIEGCQLLGIATNWTWDNAITVEKHSGGLFEGLTITNSAMVNHPDNRQSGKDWPGGIAIVKGSHNNILRNSTISWVWGEPVGIFFDANGNVISNCTIFAHWGPVDVDVSKYNIIKDCFIYNADMVVNGVNQSKQNRGVVIGNEDGAVALNSGGTSNGNRIENNVIVGYALSGIDKYDGNPFVPTGNIWRGNTIVYGTLGRYSGGVQGVIEKNILYNCSIDGVFGGTIDSNLFWTQAGRAMNDSPIEPQYRPGRGTIDIPRAASRSADGRQGTNAIAQDPGFVNPDDSWRVPGQGKKENYIARNAPGYGASITDTGGNTVGNLITNGTFGNGGAGWTPSIIGTVTYGASGAVVTVTGLGRFNQLFQAGLVTMAAEYQLTFKAAGTAPISAHLLQHTIPYGNLGLDREIALSPTMTEYTVKFVATVATDARFRFAFGRVGTYTIDDVVLQLADEVVIEPEAKGWRILYMVEGETEPRSLPPPDVGHVLAAKENGEFEWVQR